ncbi:hemolysin family protein [Rugosimonospora africana]|uniref:Membrane protein n=1 Tax=Rugosimonospora africana TaxID=556532 RepID=A0A8J3QLP9_9ACTN|nr:hemolysin family protein [Rugosimonospora africana]GIH13278.1 membrane protein [Rugosimonospora africana]
MTSLIIIVLLLGNAFFVAAEFSLIASRRTAVEPLAATSQMARSALRAMEQIPVMIAGAQLGVTICSLGLGAIAEPTLSHLVGDGLDVTHLPASAAHPIAFVLGLVAVTFLHTVLGEMVPKNLTLVGPERAVLWLGPPMLWFCTATRPLLIAMRWASRVVLKIWRIESTDAVKTVYTAEELAGLVAESRTEGLLDPEEHRRITGALALHERTAGDVLRPWNAVTTVAEDVSPASLEVLATRTGLSRFPVVDRETRRVRGFVHVKDVLGVVGQARRAPIEPTLIRPLPVIPPNRTLAEALLAMRRERRHIVLITDGRTPLGLLTLDDVLRAVVGASEGGTTNPVVRSVAS